jgi:hypothetical protein
MIKDLTVMYITANEMPKEWMNFQLKYLMDAIGDTAVVSVSRIPMSFGTNLLDEEPEKSYWNIYRQMLRAAKAAKTPFVAMAEDDTLYCKHHFSQFRPKPDQVSYNRSRWSLFCWDPIYCLRQRVSNCSMIAPRELLIEALQEREDKYPNGHDYAGEVGRPIVERNLGVTRRNAKDWYSTVPIIQLNHPDGIDDTQQRRWKKHGQIKAIEIPFWGRADEIAEVYNASREGDKKALQN